MHAITRYAAVLLTIVCAIILAGASVPQVAGAEEETFELNSGETIKGSVLEQTEDTIVIQHAIFGRQEISREDIKKKEEEEEKIEPGIFGSPVLRGWNRAFGFGFSGSTGNAEEVNLNTTLDITRETDRFRGNFGAQYFFSSTRGLTSKNQFTMGYLHDFLFGDSRWIFSAAARYDYDDFQTWRHRISAQLAPGYEIVDTEFHTLVFRAGVGVAHEFGSDPDPSRLDPILAAGANADTKPEGVFSLEYDWKIDDAQALHLDTTYFPNWKSLPESRSCCAGARSSPRRARRPCSRGSSAGSASRS